MQNDDDVSGEVSGDRPRRPWLGPAAAAVLVGLVASPLLVGLEPVGGDPDRIYRPIKAELARALRTGSLPFWSDRFGTGVPLVAESHAAAFYPLNVPLYGALGVAPAYRLAMWLHLVGCAAATALYARRVGARAWGSALAGVAFTLCGFQAIHATHEVMYCTIAYLPLCLWLAEAYAGTGRARWLALLAMASGAQWTLGHFQLQTWTLGLVLLIGGWRVLADRRPARRLIGLSVGVGWGLAIAAVQLWPSWQLARFVGQTDRSVAALAFYSFPPAHWAELALPRLFRGIAGGPMAPYWFAEQTSGYEAAMFVGTVPLILAAIGAFRPGRGLRPWLAIIAASLALATMPRWWPRGYAMFLELPGLGYFRAPARYTAIASLGLALLAGRGLDRLSPSWAYRAGLATALAFGVSAAGWGAWWSTRPAVAAAFDAEPLIERFGPPLAVWLLAIIAVAAWRRGAAPPWILPALAALELGALYYTTTTEWGWHVPMPETSPVLSRLAEEPGVRRVGGELENYPIYAGLTTATPYLGFAVPPPGRLLGVAGTREAAADPAAIRLIRRLGVTHQVWSVGIEVAGGSVIDRLRDKALDRVVDGAGGPGRRAWSIVRLPDPFPEVRVARRIEVLADESALLRRLALVDEPDVAHYLPADAPPRPPGPRARSALVTSWEGDAGVVEHDGACDLIVTRTDYPGWIALVDGAPREVRPVDGGLQAVPLEGSGASRIEFRFRPVGGLEAAGVSLAALLASAIVLVVGALRGRPRSGDANASMNPDGSSTPLNPVPSHD